ncbi:toll/interleukin-1 receptor domain-containing protein [Lentzea roselyniae]|uniref:Toll/interleukin-1 receptor domain-containing protein n=1 Tax=Lentzea roselyniae TaxID=531940 RepID=A0ABP7BTU8_9PSEU
MTPFPDAPPIRCFLSYARQDDVVMDFVDPFATALRHYAYADRGRDLEIFLDREAIGWGDLAQPAIRASVRSATVFLPVLTRRYFDRPYCREELFVFYNQAYVEGVRGLLLPVVLLGHDHLTDDNPDLAVQIIVERQHRSVREAWLDGPASPAWRRTMLALAGELVDHVEEAERRLVTEADPHLPDAAEAVADIERFGYDTGHVVELTSQVLQQFQNIVVTATDDASRAEALLPGALRLRDSARAYERRVSEVDRLVRARPVRLGPGAAALRELVDAIEQLLTSTANAELMSVPMRRPMIAFREGLTALRSAVNMVTAWKDLPNPGQ